jgi:molybdopterin converting factor small subunit
MPKVFFTANLRRHVDCPAMEAEGATVRELLANVFASHERLGTYVLDEQGSLRKHMTVLVDGVRVKDWQKLSDPVKPKSEIWVMQALSGG